MTVESEIQALLDCMCTALAEAGWEGECCLVPAVPSLEMCCGINGGGFAWGRLVRAYPTSNFPQEDFRTAQFDCDYPAQWALSVELGATTCVCDDTCSCAQKALNASDVLRYTEAALVGLTCCLTSGACAGSEHKVLAVQPLVQQGDCGGFKIEIVRQYYMNCCPPEADESPGAESPGAESV